jgi:hypothetical protein
MDSKSTSIHLDIILTIVFVILKLDGVINWKWIWVLSPLWINYLITCIVFCIVYAFLNKKSKPYKPMVYGKRTLWDAKTGRIYGDFDERED